MRFREILTEDEIYNSMVSALMDLITVYLASDADTIDIQTLINDMHRLDYDVDDKFIEEALESKSFVGSISDGQIHLKTDEEEPDQADDEAEKNQDHVEKMAQKALKKR